MCQMQAAVLHGFRQEFKINDVPIPSPSEGEVLVKVMAAGICSTDLDIQDGLINTIALPHIPGHETAGIVVENGKQATRYAVGTRVIAAIDIGCGYCRFCRIGKKNLCISLTRIGFERNGSYAQYVVVPEDNLVPFSDAISFEKAALIPDSVACMYHAIKGQGNVRGGDRVLIMGIGGLGVQGVQIAKYFGADVFCTSRNDEKLEVARNFGADCTINTKSENVKEKIDDFTNGDGCDVVFDNIGSATSIQEALDVVRPGGKVIVVGNAVKEFSVNYLSVLFYEREIIGIRASNRQDLVESVRMVESGHIDPYLFSARRLQEVNEALGLLRNNKAPGRTVLLPHL